MQTKAREGMADSKQVHNPCAASCLVIAHDGAEGQGGFEVQAHS